MPFRPSISLTLRLSLASLGFIPVWIAIYFISYWIRFEGNISRTELALFWMTAALFCGAKAITFGWFGVWRGWNRPATFHELLALLQAAFWATLTVLLIDRLFLAHLTIPRSIYVIDWGLTVVTFGGARAIARRWREHSGWPFGSAGSLRVLVVGAGEGAEVVLKALQLSKNPAYRVIGFVATDARLVGTRVAGVPVIGVLNQVPQLASDRNIQQVFVIHEELPGRDVQALVRESQQHRFEVRVLPSYQELIEGRLAIQPQRVAIEDLLRREPVVLDMENIRRWIDGRVLLVTGAAGSIGSEICRQLLKFSPARLVLVDRSENGLFFLEHSLLRTYPQASFEVCVADVLDEPRMTRLFQEHRPQIVFHAAAYKHVPLMESHPGEAVKNIITATRQIAILCDIHGVESFVLISTDKAVSPTSVMGASKRVAELFVQSLTEHSPCRFVTVRFGNVLDSAGSVVQVFREQIARGGPVTVTHPDMKRFFMTIPEAARLVIQAGAIGNRGCILTLDMGQPVSVADLAADMIRLSGLRLNEDIEIEFTGLRPGEKLVEQLHLPGEHALPTSHPSITEAKHQPALHFDLDAIIHRLEQASIWCPHEIMALLRHAVPEYTPHAPNVHASIRRAA